MVRRSIFIAASRAWSKAAIEIGGGSAVFAKLGEPCSHEAFNALQWWRANPMKAANAVSQASSPPTVP